MTKIKWTQNQNADQWFGQSGLGEYRITKRNIQGFPSFALAFHQEGRPIVAIGEFGSAAMAGEAARMHDKARRKAERGVT